MNVKISTIRLSVYLIEAIVAAILIFALWLQRYHFTSIAAALPLLLPVSFIAVDLVICGIRAKNNVVGFGSATLIFMPWIILAQYI